MDESIENLLNKREEIRETEKSLTDSIINETEKYVLSTIYFASKLDTLHPNKDVIKKGIKNLYNEKLNQGDINQALDNLVEKGILLEHKMKSPHPNEYSIKSGEFRETPLIEYLTKEYLEEIEDGDNLPF